MLLATTTEKMLLKYKQRFSNVRIEIMIQSLRLREDPEDTI